MALLRCFLAVAPSDIGVIHIHHHWRDDADLEASAVATLCRHYQLPFYLYHWQQPEKTEEAARQFRYQCCQEVMENEGYDILVTAHHLNDQIETMMRQLIRGNHPFHTTGMEELRPFGPGFLWRPFLSTPKKALEQWLQRNGWSYFYDESNHDLSYQRNRLRHQLLPLMERENPAYLQAMNRQRRQLQKEHDFVQRFMKKQLEKSMLLETDYTLSRYVFDLEQWDEPELSVWVLVEEFVTYTGIEWHEAQTNRLLRQITKREGSDDWQWQGYHFRREYTKLTIEKMQMVEETLHDVYTLNEHQSLRLDATHGVYVTDDIETLPTAIESVQSIWEIEAQPLTLRHPLPGDALAIDDQHTQKLRRLFINKKIPQHERKKQWVLVGEKEILGVMGVRKAYLRKNAKTGKINYIIYYKLKAGDDDDIIA